MGFCWSPVFSDTYRRGQLRQQNPGTKKWDGESRYHPYFVLNQSLRLHPRSSQLVEDVFFARPEPCWWTWAEVSFAISTASQATAHLTADEKGTVEIWSKCGHVPVVPVNLWVDMGCATFFVRLVSNRISQHLKMFYSQSFTGKRCVFLTFQPFQAASSTMWIITFSQLVSSWQKFLAHGSQLQIFKKGWQWKSQVGQKIQASSFISSQILKSLKS